MILLIMKSRPGLTVRRKFLQRLPLRENGNLVVKPSLRSHGGCVFVSPGLCFCVPWFRTREWCQSTGNLWAFPVVTGGSSPSRGDELRFLNKDLVVQRGRYGRWWHFSACSTFKKIETVLMYCARNRVLQRWVTWILPSASPLSRKRERLYKWVHDEDQPDFFQNSS